MNIPRVRRFPYTPITRTYVQGIEVRPIDPQGWLWEPIDPHQTFTVTYEQDFSHQLLQEQQERRLNYMLSRVHLCDVG